MDDSFSIPLFGKPRVMMSPTDDPSPTPSKKRNPQLIQEATEWFMRQSASDFSDEQQAQLDAWRQTSPAHDRAFRKVAALWESPEMALAAERVAGSAGPGTVAEQAPRRPWGSRHQAAAVAATVAAISIAFWVGGFMTWFTADYATAVGERRVVMLPDRSTMTMNTDSAVAVRYEPDRRVIRLLRGEASFTVQADMQRPFAVESHGVTATALGTEFLVRDRGDDMHVTVLHGSVEVAGPWDTPGSRMVRLGTGEQVAVGPQGPGPIAPVDAVSRAAWIKNRLVFVRAPLNEVVQELNRYHRGYIYIWNPTLQSLPVTGVYNLSDPAHIVTAVADTLPVHITRLTDYLIVIH